MRLRHSTRFMAGFRPVVEAVDGHYLLGGRAVQDGAVFERFCDALCCMNAWIISNQSRPFPKLVVGLMCVSFLHIPSLGGRK
jgi:hypothetical protein